MCGSCALGREGDVLMKRTPGNWVQSLQLQQYRLWFRRTVGKEIVLEQSHTKLYLIDWGWKMFALCLQWQCQVLGVER